MMIHKFSKTGGYHAESEKENQDYLYGMEGKDFLAIMLADGATACEKGLEGAKLACKAAAEIVSQEGTKFFRYPKEKIAYLLTEQILYYLEFHAKEENELWEYGSTFALVFMEKKTGRTVVVNLGDGAILTVKENRFFYLLKPRKIRGNPCLTTTKGANKAIEVEEFNLGLGDSMLICSDGFLHEIRTETLVEKLNLYDVKGLDDELNQRNNADDCSYISFTRERR